MRLAISYTLGKFRQEISAQTLYQEGYAEWFPYIHWFGSFTKAVLTGRSMIGCIDYQGDIC